MSLFFVLHVLIFLMLCLLSYSAAWKSKEAEGVTVLYRETPGSFRSSKSRGFGFK